LVKPRKKTSQVSIDRQASYRLSARSISQHRIAINKTCEVYATVEVPQNWR
jgi:hypothetical protein